MKPLTIIHSTPGVLQLDDAFRRKGQENVERIASHRNLGHHQLIF